MNTITMTAINPYLEVQLTFYFANSLILLPVGFAGDMRPVDYQGQTRPEGVPFRDDRSWEDHYFTSPGLTRKMLCVGFFCTVSISSFGVCGASELCGIAEFRSWPGSTIPFELPRRRPLPLAGPALPGSAPPRRPLPGLPLGDSFVWAPASGSGPPLNLPLPW